MNLEPIDTSTTAGKAEACEMKHEYLVASDRHEHSLCKKVEALLADGFVCQGGICANSMVGNYVYMQAMTRSTPAPNWCRACGRHWKDPMAVFCSDPIHRPADLAGEVN